MTGRTTKKFDGRPWQQVFPPQMSGDNLVFRKDGTPGLTASVSWNPRTDKETPYCNCTLSDDYELKDPEHTNVFVAHGNLIFPRHEARRDDGYPEDPVTVALPYHSIGLRKHRKNERAGWRTETRGAIPDLRTQPSPSVSAFAPPL